MILMLSSSFFDRPDITVTAEWALKTSFLLPSFYCYCCAVLFMLNVVLIAIILYIIHCQPVVVLEGNCK